MSLYNTVTESIIELMENAGSWEKLWTCLGSNFAPKNHSTGKFYTGVNTLILANSMCVNQFRVNEWMTFNQAKEKGYKVKKGSVSTHCAKFGTYEDKNELVGENDEPSKKSFLKPFFLFNLDQLEGCEDYIEQQLGKTPDEQKDIIKAGEKVIRHIKSKGCNIVEGSNRACYIPSLDLIEMPSLEQFFKPENYYSVMFHEVSHWTAHSARLDRDLSGRFGDSKYAMEELIAELSSAFTCAQVGIVKTTLDDHAKYLKSWVSVLRNDNKAIFTASAKAQKAHEFIMEGLNVNEDDCTASNIEEMKKTA